MQSSICQLGPSSRIRARELDHVIVALLKVSLPQFETLFVSAILNTFLVLPPDLIPCGCPRLVHTGLHPAAVIGWGENRLERAVAVPLDDGREVSISSVSLEHPSNQNVRYFADETGLDLRLSRSLAERPHISAHLLQTRPDRVDLPGSRGTRPAQPARAATPAAAVCVGCDEETAVGVVVLRAQRVGGGFVVDAQVLG